MTIRSWVRKLFARTQRTTCKAPARTRLRLEALEDRAVPAALVAPGLGLEAGAAITSVSTVKNPTQALDAAMTPTALQLEAFLTRPDGGRLEVDGGFLREGYYLGRGADEPSLTNVAAALARGHSTMNQSAATSVSTAENPTQALAAAMTPTASQLQVLRSYISGVGLVIDAVIKFKMHKDSPTQTPLDRPLP